MTETNLAVLKPANPIPASAEWESKLDLIKRTVAVGATADELAMFFHQAKKTGLDPLARQIYFVKRDGKGTIQTGIDGYRLVADRTGKYAGNEDPVFEEPQGALNPSKATVTVWKIVEGVRCPFTASARWSQYYPGEKQGWAWRKMPHLMLGKCAEALALRKAFPAELSGVYTHEEMEQSGGNHINTLVGACVDCGAEIPADETKCSGCRKPAAALPEKPKVCESCGADVVALELTKKGSKKKEVIPVEKVLEKAMEEHGRPVCGLCQLKIAKAKKEGDELGITDKEIQSVIPGDEEPLPF